MTNTAVNTDDTDDLEALFDSISQASGWTGSDTPPEPVAEPPAANAAACADATPTDAEMKECCRSIFSQVGQVTRMLHDSLTHLGYDKGIEEVVKSMPDAQDRLNYISAMTKQAAERALNAAEAARPLQSGMEEGAKALNQRWEALMRKELAVDEFRKLVLDTRGYLGDVPRHTRETNAQLMEVVMAQDFQDLTGQVIKKVVDLVQQVEGELVKLLIAAKPGTPQAMHLDGSLENGPVVKSDGRSDVVTSQEQVDDLLASLGF